MSRASSPADAVAAAPAFAIRDARPGDAAAIDGLLRAAFAGPDEARLVSALRDAGAATVELVAVGGEGSVIGHVLFSPLMVERDAGETAAAALAPLAVAASFRRRGIGAALCEAGIARCREAGCAGVVVLGDPGYYRRFGFDPALAEGLACPWSGPHLMAIAFAPGAPGAFGGPGRLRYRPEFGGS